MADDDVYRRNAEEGRGRRRHSYSSSTFRRDSDNDSRNRDQRPRDSRVDEQRDRRRNFDSGRDSPNGRQDRERDRDRKRDRRDEAEFEQSGRRRDCERDDRETSHRDRGDRPSEDPRYRGGSPSKRVRHGSPPHRSHGSDREGRARATDYLPSARSMLEQEDVKPRLSETSPEPSDRSYGAMKVLERKPSIAGITEEGRRDPGTPGRARKYDARDRFDNVHSRNASLSTKQGESGCPVDLVANYFPMVTKPSWCLYNYRVDFTPDEERPFVKKRLLRVYNAVIGANIFDGSNMYTMRRLEADPMILVSERESDQVQVQLTIRFTGQIPPGHIQYLQFYNIIIRTCMTALNFQEIGRNFYDRHSAIKVPQHQLELWPGYVTTLRNYEDSLMLCVEVTHKVLRLETCLDIIYAQDRERDSRQRSSEILVGTIVMTHYNRKTYRIDDIDWTKNPLCSFEMKGKSISLADYYQAKYDIRIRDLNQPLLVSNPRRRDLQGGDATPILLVPELCQMTGLTDDIRRNYKTMKDLSAYLQQAPERRVENINNFMRRLRCCTDVREMMSKWGMEFEGRLIPVRGRILPAEQVIFRSGVEPDVVKVGPSADWTFGLKSKSMYSSMRLTRWALIVTHRDARGVEGLLQTMRAVGNTLDFEIAPPQSLIKLPDIKIPTFLNAIDQAMAEFRHVDAIFVILPNQQLDLYAAVKKRCCIDYGVVSQCFLAKHLQPNVKGLMSIVTKVVVQLNAKLGGEPWATHNPLKASHTMIVGYDVYHCAKKTGPSVGAMVATTNKDLSRYYSTVSFHSTKEELSETICSDLTKCVYAFRTKNKDELPDRIIVYRDGVGEGHLSYVYNTELVQMRTALLALYTGVGRPPPKFTLIICTKRGNARVFHKSGHGFRNPDAGTIVDNTITLPERFDYYLISQASRQGTASPTAYNVLYDEQNLDPDKIQRLTFKLCHLYYNYSGSLAVPAVCQYGHKLAYLSGLALAAAANERLAHYLYFL